MIFTLLSFAIAVDPFAVCPKEVQFDLLSPKQLNSSQWNFIPQLLSNVSLLQVYEIQPTLKSGRVWYQSTDGEAVIYYCMDAGIWIVAAKFFLKDFDAKANFTAEDCVYVAFLHVPSIDRLVDLGHSREQLDAIHDYQKNFTCPVSTYPSGWLLGSPDGVFDSAAVYGVGFTLDSLLVSRKQQVGDECDGNYLDPYTLKQCSGFAKCGDDKKCVCEDVPSPLNLTGPDGCILVAEMANKTFTDMICGCYPSAKFKCRKLCESCDGVLHIWPLSKCEPLYPELEKFFDDSLGVKQDSDGKPEDDDAGISTKTILVIITLSVVGCLSAVAIGLFLYIKVCKKENPGDVESALGTTPSTVSSQSPTTKVGKASRK